MRRYGVGGERERRDSPCARACEPSSEVVRLGGVVSIVHPNLLFRSGGVLMITCVSAFEFFLCTRFSVPLSSAPFDFLSKRSLVWSSEKKKHLTIEVYHQLTLPLCSYM